MDLYYPNRVTFILGDFQMKDYYHLSFNPRLPVTLKPRQPDGSDLSEALDEEAKKEDLPPRVSFSPSYKECFIAIYPNISHLIVDNKGMFKTKELYIYAYRMVPDQRLKQIPERVVKQHVWDWGYTHEICILEPVKIEKHKRLRIHFDTKRHVKANEVCEGAEIASYISKIEELEFE